MGDPISITTWPRHQNLFYQANASGIMFEIKAPGNAVVGLCKKPGLEVDYWIGIGENNRCWIKKDNEHLKSIPVPNLLSPDRYTRFWLQWNAGSIRLGRPGDQKPIVTCSNRQSDLKYVTFSVLNQFNPVHWRFELPPVKPQAQISKPIRGGKLYWVEADNQLPDGALIGGFENEALYIIRASHSGSVTPGKFVPSEGGGYISWGGDAHGKNEFEILCGYDCIWVPAVGDRIPVGAFVGGYSEDRNERLYIGRAVHNGHTIPGKVQASHKVCYIPFEGREIAKKKYEILVEPGKVRSANDHYFCEMLPDSDSESEQEDDHTWQADDDLAEEMFGYDSNDDLNELMAL